METKEKPESSREYYKAHILKAQSFSGSDLEYCRQNGLVPGTFYRFKRGLGLARPRKTKFLKVEPLPSRVLVAPKPQWVEFPNAEWLAQFLKVFLRSQ